MLYLCHKEQGRPVVLARVRRLFSQAGKVTYCRCLLYVIPKLALEEAVKGQQGGILI